ncbi:type IV pili methyl-accepting chemotaxis transducer N-terminal domain-containing protein [Joostella atrarenae]|uniref:Oxygen sensor histidine kinase NreB n=1 Tax=Joostella atrarenae TaxID=679257 RepID=A0ABS9J4E1_9FLAO|nr:type IV pili methyl-accepting chemotaxis transducer N-terminal domain-containing protein [Joostella atrarenae]MCF8715301.1 type IV pili methyl-accepting chemotaxis transducer N-terminal domain-containing protein [Joostella atrarenae]
MSTKVNSLDQNTFNKLRQLYIIALSAIALSVIISQLLVRKFLSDQQDDAKIINIAGRQRMLSQKLTKEVLLLSNKEGSLDKKDALIEIKKTLLLWESSHQSLQNGNDSLHIEGDNSEAIKEMFDELQPSFSQIQTSVNNILHEANTDATIFKDDFQQEIKVLLIQEQEFLAIMDRIVNQYDKEATHKVEKLQKLESILLVVTLAILLAEFLFIFWPAAKRTKQTIKNLLVSEEKAKEMAYNADVLSQAKEKSVNQLKALSLVMEQTLLFARITPDGYLVHLGSKFSSKFNHRSFSTTTKFSEIISTDEKEQEQIENIISNNQNTGWQGEIKGTLTNDEAIWLEMSVIPYHPGDQKEELLLICFEITERKKAQLQIERLNKERFEAKIDQQKTLSAKIIENQEQEQNRIAKDIHDGIGQMLTGLKFNIESIDVKNTAKAAEKIEHLKELTSNIIKGVRTATFNLTPPELTDHGVVPALSKLTQELAKFTGKNIVLFNKTEFSDRLDSLAEINIYRITQEAVNNAIKYADSTHIIITVSHSKELLSVTIDDNGKGFDTNKLKPRENGEGGMGLTFMKERINYINGRLFMNSSPGKGTRVTINVPI